MPRILLIGLLALFVIPGLSACSKNSSSGSQRAANPNDPVVARVNGAEIRQSDLDVAEEDLGSDLQGPPEQKREQLISYVTDVLLVAQAAEKQKLAESPEFQQREALMRNKLLMSLFLEEQGKSAATDDEMHKVYEEQVKPMGAEEEVRARHILVNTEDEAKAIAEQIKSGADFATVAKEKSQDPGSAQEGGDLGYFVKAKMVPAFSEVAFKMYPGQVSNPIKTQFGWHIIKVEDRRTQPVPQYDQVRGQIETFVARRAQSALVAQLRQGAKIERLDKPAATQGKSPAGSAEPAPKK
jgi:peptidyl-prolyl cis-trans isomerase C